MRGKIRRDFGSLTASADVFTHSAPMRFAFPSQAHPSVEYIHCDVFDGVECPSPSALTFGPTMIRAIRGRTKLRLDVHLVVKHPSTYVDVMAESGCDCLIVQYESFENKREELRACLSAIRRRGMEAGVCLAPGTPAEAIKGELEGGELDVVDLLTVNPCFAKQKIQLHALSKVRKVREMAVGGDDGGVRVIVDGGINEDTAAAVFESGADTLVSGSYLFGHKNSVKTGVDALMKRR